MPALLFLGEPCELGAVEDPGQIGILGLPVIIQMLSRYYTPEVLLLQFHVIRSFYKNTFDGISCLERNFRRLD